MALEALIQKIAEINPILGDVLAKNPWMLPLIALQAILKVILYPIALYYSAKRKQKTWFVVLFLCLLFLNDFGLLPALYLIIYKGFEKQDAKKVKAKKK